MELTEDSLAEAYNRLTDRIEQALSSQFVEMLERDYPVTMFSREKNSFIRSTMSAGYLIRTAEESFGERPTIQDEEIARLLSHREKAHLDRLCDATNALDMRCRTYELSGLEAKLFVNRTVVEPFEGMVAALASRWYPDLGCSGLLQFRKRKIAREWTFRNAVWGYLFRAVEASAWV